MDSPTPGLGPARRASRGPAGVSAIAEGPPMIRPTDPAAPTRRSAVSRTLVAAFAVSIVPAAAADEAGGGGAYLAFIRARAAALRAGDAPPRSLGEWTKRRTEVRLRLARRSGRSPTRPPRSIPPATARSTAMATESRR